MTVPKDLPAVRLALSRFAGAAQDARSFATRNPATSPRSGGTDKHLGAITPAVLSRVSQAARVTIDLDGSSMLIQREDGRREMLDLAHLADRHLRPGWVRITPSSQGATCDRLLAHLKALRANTVDARLFYVAISRARHGATIYTDSRANLTEALGLRDGNQVGAIDETMKAPDVVTAAPATVKAVGMAISG